jgi:hypothetical protein
VWGPGADANDVAPLSSVVVNGYSGVALAAPGPGAGASRKVRALLGAEASPAGAATGIFLFFGTKRSGVLQSDCAGPLCCWRCLLALPASATC